MVKKSLELEWKDFNVSLDEMEKWCRDNCPSYLGNSADSKLKLHFSKDESEAAEEIAAAQEKWDEIEDEDHPFAKAYLSSSDREEMLQELKADAASKTWNQLNGVQRKLVMNVSVSLADIKSAHAAMQASNQAPAQ